MEITNTGTAPLLTIKPAISGDPQFSLAANGMTCGSTLAVGAKCNVGVTFRPTTIGATAPMTLNINANAPNPPQKVTLVNGQ